MKINAGNSSLTVGTASVTVSEAKTVSQRVRLNVVNVSTGAQVISLAVDQEAVASSGIVLYPGGSQTWEIQSLIPIPQGRISAISSAAGGTLAIYEEVLQ